MSLVKDKIQEGMTGITFFGGWGFVIVTLIAFIVTLIAFIALDSTFLLFFLVGLGVVEIGGDLTKALFFKKRPNGQKYKTLPEFWQTVSKFNPILYMVNGFRYGFLGISDVNVHLGVVILLAFVGVMVIYDLRLLRKGIGLRN